MFRALAFTRCASFARRRTARWLALGLGAATLAACRADARSPAHPAGTTHTAYAALSVTDDAGRVVRLAAPAQRVISLIPSVTETLIALGAGNQIVARTRYDVAPQVATLPSVGGGLDPSIEKIVSLHPDLVLAWDNDARRAAPAKLMSLGIAVFTLRTEDTTGVFRGIANLGRLTGHDAVAAALTTSLHAQLAEVRRSVAGRPEPSVFYVVYNDPPMTTGPDTFIGQLIALAGGRSVFADARELWPTVTVEEIVRRDPDLIILPTGEFKTNSVERMRELPGWRDLRAVRNNHVITVPADLLSRPGPDIGEAARVLRAAFHPELDPAARRDSSDGHALAHGAADAP